MANLACFRKCEVFFKLKNVKKIQKDVAKVGEEERKKEQEQERNRVHRGSFQNLKMTHPLLQYAL